MNNAQVMVIPNHNILIGFDFGEEHLPSGLTVHSILSDPLISLIFDIS